MKFLYITILTILTTQFGNSQSEIHNLDGWNGEGLENAYYSDINNFLDPFEGTWLYTNSNTSFKLTLYKETMLYTGRFYVDYLSGEYQYIENGIEKANTLNNNNSNQQGIWGNSLLKDSDIPICHDCQPNSRRVRVIISDRTRNLNGVLILKLKFFNSEPAIEGLITGGAPKIIEEGNPPPFTEMIIPRGTFTFIKQ